MSQDNTKSRSKFHDDPNNRKEGGDGDAEDGGEGQQQQPPISRLDSITDRVTDVTKRTREMMVNIKEQARPTKSSTVLNKKTLDGIMIDERLTTETGIIFKAKMIGSLSVKAHHGDRMAMEAMRDLKTFARTSGRHKARIFIRLSIFGVQILEDASLRVIDNHDLDKISYLTQDVDERNVFAYIYNKQILNKEKGTSSISHRLFAIKSPKCTLMVSHMKAAFHYMYETRKTTTRENTTNVNMQQIKKSVETAKEEAAKNPTESMPEPAQGANAQNFNYGKLVDLVDIVTDEDTINAEDRNDPLSIQGLALSERRGEPANSNLYTTMPGSSSGKLPIPADNEEEDDEPVYSTVRKIQDKPGPVDEVGMLNPTWNKAESLSIPEEDPFSFDTYNKGQVSSSSSEDEDTFIIPASRQAATIPSTVFVDDYEWDIGEPRPKTYSEGNMELQSNRERLSTITKKAIATLERNKQEGEKEASKRQNSSLIDFATFEDKMESGDVLEMFDTLGQSSKFKPSVPTATLDHRTDTAAHNDLLSLDFGASSTPQKTPSVQHQPGSEKYDIDINSLINNPSTYANTGTGLSREKGPSPSYGMFGTDFSNSFTGGYGATQPHQAQPNYQPVYTFPVQFNEEKPKPQPTSNPFHQPKSISKTTNDFDPFGDLLNDAI